LTKSYAGMPLIKAVQELEGLGYTVSAEDITGKHVDRRDIELVLGVRISGNNAALKVSAFRTRPDGAE